MLHECLGHAIEGTRKLRQFLRPAEVETLIQVARGHSVGGLGQAVERSG